MESIIEIQQRIAELDIAIDNVTNVLEHGKVMQDDELLMYTLMRYIDEQQHLRQALSYVKLEMQ